MARMRILAESLRPAERLPSPKLRRVGGTTGQMQLAPSYCPNSGIAPICRIRPNSSSTFHDSAILPASMRYAEMPVNSTLLPVGGIPMYSPWWVALALQRATTLSPSAMRSSMVLTTSGKPWRKSAASCLAASAWSGTKSSSAASRLPV
jgi:hypothetical protein